MNLGDISSVVGLPWLDLGKLISLIVKAASTAREFKRQIISFATYIRVLSRLLRKKQLSDLRKHQDVREVLEQLDIALIRGCRLVNKCRNCSWVYAVTSGRKMMDQFREVEVDVNKYLAMFQLAAFGCNSSGTHGEGEEQPPRTMEKVRHTSLGPDHHDLHSCFRIAVLIAEEGEAQQAKEGDGGPHPSR